MLQLRTPAWLAALALTASPVSADPAPTTPIQRNVLVATTVSDSTNTLVGVMNSEQTCWQAAFMLAKSSPAQVFYCVANPTSSPAVSPKGTVRS